MRNVVLSCAFLIYMAGVAVAADCGQGIVCFSPSVTINAGTSTSTLTVVGANGSTRTSSSSGNGVEISAIYCYASDGSLHVNTLIFSKLHSAVSTPWWQVQNNNGAGSASSMTNLLLTNAVNNSTAPYIAVPSNSLGNSVLHLSPGDSIQVAPTVGLTGGYILNCHFEMRQF